MNAAKIKNYVEKIKANGFISIDNFLDREEIKKIDNCLKKISSKNINKGDKRSYYPVSIKTKFVKLLKFDFYSIKSSLILQNIAKKLDLNKIAETYFGSDVVLSMIDSYYSPISKKNIIDWHSDMTFDPNKNYNIKDASLKFFFYLTNTQSDNGCLAFIPHSNLITKALAQLIIEKKIPFNPYWNLFDLRTLILIEQNRNLISRIVGKEKVDTFLKNTEFIEGELKDTKKFDIEMEKGGVVIFDEFGVHRGSMPSKTPRQVLRFFYRKN